ncbi:uncharacterized protein LOC108049591 [Drosophila rhopaloa]|uniref:Uncharacterized protein LOC108049591 n=1 Tax=Drosophila rhopaloa TaxID=1041015 RepID=A0A6P4F799_DRORH|nr:uncharacterized protein LOC108049591 [Drosophila rhopaloa]
MFLKVFMKGTDKSRRAPLIRLETDDKVHHLKSELEKHAKIPVHSQNIVFLDKILSDEDRLTHVFRECETFGTISNEIDAHEADIMAFYKDDLVCRMRFLEDLGCGSPRSSCIMDQDLEWPAELHSQIHGLVRGCSSNESSMQESSTSTSSASSSMGGTTTSMTIQKSGAACCPSDEDDHEDHDPCLVRCCNEGDDDRPPYARVMPEDRRFGVVITNDDDPCDCQFACILIFLVEQFQGSAEAGSLSFSQCTSAVTFDCALLIVCEDTETSDWILRMTRPMCPPYKCTTFIKHFELVRCSFVIPMVVKRELCRIFNVMEKQNCGLDTSKWCVMSKTLLDKCSEEYPTKVIYDEAPNWEIIAYIDQESVDYINKHCYKLKFMMWHLPFDFCQTNVCH